MFSVKATNYYDDANRLIASKNAKGNKTTTTYDDVGRKTQLINPLGKIWTTNYDDAGRIESTQNPLGHRTTFTYYETGLRKQTLDAEGNITTTLYDVAGRPETTINGLGDKTTISYDDAGRREALTDAKGNTTTFGYDVAGQMELETNPAGNRTTITYDAIGQMETRTNARGIATTFLYEKNGWLKGRQYTNDLPVTLQYDSRGNRKLMWDSTGKTTSTYDEVSRTKTVQNPRGETLAYTYDETNNRKTMVEPTGGTFTYHYDELGRSDWLDNPYGERTSFSYDVANREMLRELSNGTSVSTSYDAANQVHLIENLTSTGGTILNFTYTYDKVGNRTKSEESSGDTVDWDYDESYQLKNEKRTGSNAYNTTFQYDAAGNREVLNADGALTTSTYNGLNQLEAAESSVGTTTYTYDAAGNQTLQTVPSGDTTGYEWDDENRRTRLSYNSISSQTASYNGDGLRVQTDDTLTADFLWDGQRYLAVTTSLSGTLANRQVYTQGVGRWGDLISRRGSDSWEREWLHFDAIGSTRVMTKEDESVDGTRIYSAFGEAVASTGSLMIPLNFVGRYGYYQDGIYGPNPGDQYYVRARFYDSGIGRWLSVDQRDISGAINLYQYSDLNPTTFIDPSGFAASLYSVIYQPQEELRGFPWKTDEDLRTWRNYGESDTQMIITCRCTYWTHVYWTDSIVCVGFHFHYVPRYKVILRSELYMAPKYIESSNTADLNGVYGHELQHIQSLRTEALRLLTTIPKPTPQSQKSRKAVRRQLDQPFSDN